jgi:hypothetical protein
MAEPKKHKKREYWGKIEEEAVARYLRLPESSPEADRIFNEFIYDPMVMLVENIMFTYHLVVPDVAVKDQILDTVSFVVLKMRKYDVDRGPKSFSYYGTIAKNYMILKKNTHHKKRSEYLPIENMDGFEVVNNLCEEHGYEKEINSDEFLINITADKISTMLETERGLDANTYKLGEAVVTLLGNYQYINVNNKRQFYFLAKEFTGLQTKEITKSLQKLKAIFAETRKSIK